MIYRCFKSGSLTLFFFVLSFTYPLEIFSEKKKSTYSVAQTPQSPKPSTESKKTNQSQTSEARFVDYFAQERLLQGHKGSINDASFSPDGKYIVIAGSDGDARLWNISDVETRYIASLKGHKGNVKTANFSPDGKLIVTSSFDGTVRVWNLLGNELVVLKGHRGNVYSANFSPDGKRIVTAGTDKTVRVWDVSGQQLAEITGHSGSVYSANFSPDGKQIVTTSADKTARLWNISGKLLAELQGHSDTVWSANFSPDGKRIVTASDDKTARIWDVSGKLLAVLSGHNESVYSADFSTDGKQIVTASLDFTGLIWDASGKLIGKLEQHTGGVNSAGFSRDGKWIVTASNDGTVGVWDLSTKLSTELQGHLESVSNASFSPDGKRIVTISSDKTVRIWDILGKKVAILKNKLRWKSASFSPDSKMVITLSGDKMARVWDTSGRLITEISGLTPDEQKQKDEKIKDKLSDVVSANFSPDGKYVITVGITKNVRLWDISGKLFTELKEPQSKVNSANFSPNGKFIITTSDKTATVWDISGKKVLQLEHSNAIGSAMFSPDNNHILTASIHNVYLWDTSGKLLMKSERNILSILAPLFSPVMGQNLHSFSPNSKLIITGGDISLNKGYPQVKVLDLSGKQRATFEGLGAKFSPEGKKIITKVLNQAFLWDVSSGKLLKRFQPSVFIRSIEFSPDGQKIIMTSDDVNPRIWYISDKSLEKNNPINKKSNRINKNQEISNKKESSNIWGYSNAIFSPDNRHIMIIAGSSVEIWDISGRLLSQLKINSIITSAKFSPNGQHIITASTDKKARLWSKSGKLLQEFQADRFGIKIVDFSRDGKHIYALSINKTIHIWNTSGKLVKKYIGSQNIFQNIDFHPGSKKVLTITTNLKNLFSDSSNTASVWSISGKLLAEIKGDKLLIQNAKFSPDGKKIITVSHTITDDDETYEKIHIWNTQGKQLALLKLREVEDYLDVQDVNFTPDGKIIITTEHDKDSVKVWDMDGNLVTERINHKSYSITANFSTDGKFIVTTSGGNTVQIWDTSGKQLQVLKAHTSFANASYTSDGKKIITITDNGAAQIWDALSKKLLSEIKGYRQVWNAIVRSDISIYSGTDSNQWADNASLWHINGKFLMKLNKESEIKNFVFSPSRKNIITISYSGDMSIWNISGKKLTQIKKRKVSIANFSLDEQHIFTVSDDNVARIWDISGKLLAELKGHQDKIIAFVIRADGKQIYTASLDGSIRLWNMKGQLIKTALLDSKDKESYYQSIFSFLNKNNFDEIDVKIKNNGQFSIYTDSSSLSKTNQPIFLGSIDKTGINKFIENKPIVPFMKIWKLNIDSITFTKNKPIKITSYADISLQGNYLRLYFKGFLDIKGLIKLSALGVIKSPQLNTATLIDLSFNTDDASNNKSPIIREGVPVQLKGHQYNINSINLSPDGKHIITASSDGTTRVWDTNGKIISTLSLDVSPSSPQVEAGRLRDLDFYAPNCSLGLEPWQKALNIYQKISDYKNQAVIHQKLGSAYYCLADFSNAIDSYSQAIKLAQEHNYLDLKAQNFANLGKVYNTLADNIQALEYYDKAFNIIQNQQNLQLKSEILQGRGNIYYSQGKYNQARTEYQQALKINQALKNQAEIGRNKLKLANINLNLGNYSQAIQFYKKTSQFAPTEALSGLGNTYLFLGDTSKAINYYQQSLDKARQIEDKEAEANALNNLANALRKLNKDKLPEAEKYLLAAIEIWENLRVNLEDANKISIFEKQTRTYRLLQEILIAQNKINEALEISERGRARAFVELLSKRLSPDKNEESQIALPNINQIQKIAKAQNSTLIQYSIITDEFKINGKPQTKESELYTWVVKPSGEVSFRQTDLKPLWQNENTNLSKLIKNTRLSIGAVDIRSRQAGGLIASGNNLDKEKQTRSLQRLHQLLINPIADLLPKNPSARVTFIPQDSLFLVPFPALQNKNGQYLIEKHTILTSPSIQVLDLTRKQKQKNSLTKLDSSNALVVGNPEMPSIALQPGEPAKKLPNLPGAETEAKAIAPMLNTKAITGSAATEAEIVQKMPKAQIIHLATHGLFDDLRGLGSALAFNTSPKDDGLLTAEEILDMKLNADLVVLSACDTGRGRITGDGVIGLSRSFISAGVPSIVVSLWSVDDDSTAFLMTEFYQNLQQGIDKGTALRKAMLSAKEKYENPLQWAAFTLIGEAE